MSWCMFAAPSIARKKGSAPNHDRILHALEALSSPPSELLSRMQQAIKEDDKYPTIRKALRVVERLGVQITLSRADIEPLYKAYVQLYGPFQDTRVGEMEQALQFYAFLLARMEYHLETQRRIASTAQAYMAQMSSHTEELDALAGAYNTRFTTHEGQTNKYFYPHPQTLGDMLYAMANNKPAEGNRGSAEYADPSAAISSSAFPLTDLPDLAANVKINAIVGKRVESLKLAIASATDALEKVAMYDAAEVRSLGFVPVLTDEAGATISDLTELTKAFKRERDATFGTGTVRKSGLAIRFVGTEK
jgi:hypothetical protein